MSGLADVFRRCLRRLVSALLLVVVLAEGTAGAAQLPSSSSSGEYRAEAVRAVFLVNFIRFTEWPAESLPENAPFVVGIAGSRLLEDELIGLVETLKVRFRRVHVVRIKTPRDLEGCHLLYVSPVSSLGDEPAPTQEELLPQVRNKPVLTVSESPTFLAQGGIVNLYSIEGGNLRFEIAPEAATAGGLVLSSKLLALARIVRPPVPGTTP